MGKRFSLSDRMAMRFATRSKSNPRSSVASLLAALLAPLLAPLGLTVPATALSDPLDVAWETHGSLRISNPANGSAVIVDDCWMISSETGVFPMPSPHGDALVGVACSQSDGRFRAHVLQARDLAALYGSEPSETLHLRLLQQGLMIGADGDTTIWEADDRHMGAATFFDANGLASGLPYRPGQVLWPRLKAGHYRVAKDPMTPLRLGPSEDAPYFERLRGYLLIHLGDGTEDGFWQIGDDLRLCVPDGGCGYATRSAVQPVHNLDDDPLATNILTTAIGPRDPDLACWPIDRADVSDGGVTCYRILDIFEITTESNGNAAGILVVASGVETIDDGALMRCAACQSSLLLAFAPEAASNTVIQSAPVAMGSWGEGPTLEDLALDIPTQSTPVQWQLDVTETYNDRGTVIVRRHEFFPASDRIEHRLADMQILEQQREESPGIIRVESAPD